MRTISTSAERRPTIRPAATSIRTRARVQPARANARPPIPLLPAHITLQVQLPILAGAFALLLLTAAQASAQVTATPSGEIFSAPQATVVFTVTVPPGSSLGGFSVLTLGAPDLDFTQVAAGTTCPTLAAGRCTIEVVFQPTAPGRRQGAVVLNDANGNVLLGVSLDGAGSGALAAFGPGTISTFAGNSGLARSAPLAGPTGITVDGFGNHYIADQAGNTVRKVSAAGVISTFAGTGVAGYSGDGAAAANATLSGPMSVLVDGAGFVYIADTGNNVVRMVSPAGTISTYAGQYYANGAAPPAVCAAATNPVGDGCPGNQIVLNTPVNLVFCHAQNLHISDMLNHRVRTVMRATYQTITQVGTGVAGYNGDGELNTSANLNGPTGMAMDAANYIYVADSGNHIIRKTLLTGTIPNPISTIAGTPGSAGNTGDDGLAINALLTNPFGVQVDAAGDVYISDSVSQVIRKVNAATGLITTIAGVATAGSSGDNGAASSAQLNGPSGLLVDAVGNLYIADSQNAAVREVDVADAPGLTFASAIVGTASAAQDVTVMNLGASSCTINATGAPANFSLAGPDTSCNLSGGQALAPATSCILGIEFIPATAGSINGSIVLTDDSSPAVQTIALTGTATPQPESQTISFAALPDKVYGDPAFALGATASSGLPVSFSVVTGPVTVSDGVASITGAGAVTIRAAEPGNASYLAAANVDQSFGVTPEAINVVASSQSKLYGDPDPALSYGINSGSLALGDAFSGALVRDAGENVGAYAIRQGTLTLSGNYDLTVTGASLTINKATPMLSWFGRASATCEQLATLGATLAFGSGSAQAAAAIASESVVLMLGTQSCTGVTQANSGQAACALTVNQPSGDYTASASFAGDRNFLPASVAAPFLIAPDPTTVLYTGATQGVFLGTVRFGALLTETSSGTPAAAGTLVHFSLGQPVELQGCSGAVDDAGDASCSIQLEQPAGSYAILAAASGNGDYQASAATAPFTVAADTTRLAYTGPTVVSNGAPITLSASFLEAFTQAPIAGALIGFALGPQGCSGATDANGSATCTIAVVSQAPGPAAITLSFEGNGDYLGVSADANLVVEAAAAPDGGGAADAGAPTDGGSGQAAGESGCATAGGSTALWGLLLAGLKRRRRRLGLSTRGGR